MFDSLRTRRGSSPRLVHLGMMLACALATSCSRQARAGDLMDAGAALYSGTVAMQAHLAGDTDALPVVATRCINCHELAAGAATSAPSVAAGQRPAGAGSYAAALNRTWLVMPQTRHGGPATQYDAASFCTLVRTGEDPAHVLIPPVMPRYDATDAQCESLWTYLRSRE